MMTLLTSRALSPSGYPAGSAGHISCPKVVCLPNLNGYSLLNSCYRFNHFSFSSYAVLLNYCVLLGLAILLTLVHVLPSYAQTNGGDLFIPETQATYNPLRTSTGQKKSSYMLPGEGLTNEDLVNAANDIRTSNMSTEQRALNHQWLDHENYVDDAHVGGKVLSHIFKMGFKTYWKDVRNKKYSQSSIVPSEEGVGQLTSDVDYKLRINGDNVNLSVEYDF